MNQPSLTWTDDETPVATDFDDPYFTGGLEETRHVFLDGNDLPNRLRTGFHVAELGFGTGLNLLALAAIAPGSGGVRFTSFEAYPMAAADMARALARFALPHTGAMVDQWARGGGAVRALSLPGVEARVIIGDARETLPLWDGRADAWFLDGFAPARNPQLWGDELMQQVAAHSAPGATLASYTAAGQVRRALAAAGFEVSRIAGYGRKKHMTQARMPR